MEISNLYIYPFTEHTMPLCRFNDRLQQFDHVNMVGFSIDSLAKKFRDVSK